jgi:hypothetical protein
VQSFDADTNELTATFSGGVSSNNPLVDWRATFEGPGGLIREWNGVNTPPPWLTETIVEDGDYGFSLEVCNAVGCESAQVCCETVTLAGPPGPMDPPVLTATYPSFQNSVEVTASWTEPADNGGSEIIDYVWELDWGGSSGDRHQENGTTGLVQERLVATWPGYTSHPQGSNAGSTIEWTYRVAAVNAEGQGEFSDWAAISPTMQEPQITVSTNDFAMCPDSDPTEPMFCVQLGIGLRGFGLGGNYPVTFVRNAGVRLQPGGCGGVTVRADANGDRATQTINCFVDEAGFPADLRVEIDGYSSPNITVDW